MKESDIEAMMVACIPEWAIKRSDGTLEMGSQLPTRDGRRCGNAHIIDILRKTAPQFEDAFTVLTDAGTRMVCTAAEIEELFHPPQWVADYTEVMLKFSR
jgi:hypothetical protein